MWNMLSAGTHKLRTGTTMQMVISAVKKNSQPLVPNNAGGSGNCKVEVLCVMSCLRTAAFHGKDALGAFLDEHDDENQHRNLGQHRTSHTLKQFVH